MYLDRNDLRGIVKFLAILSFVAAFLFVAMNLGHTEGMKKDRATGRVYWTEAWESRTSSMGYGMIPLTIGVALVLLLSSRSLSR